MLLRDSALIYFHVKVAYIGLYSSIQECIFYAAAINVSNMRVECDIFIFSIQNMFDMPPKCYSLPSSEPRINL